MSKPGSHVSSSRAGRTRRTDAPHIRGSGRPERLAPEVQQWFAAEGAGFASSRSSIIPMLQSAQASLGYLPGDAMQAIARHLVVPAAVVEGVASFYAQFRFEKPGEHSVTVCCGTACYVRGSGKLLEELEADLEVRSGGTTADGAISLESVSCFGACALAPVVVVDEKVQRQQTSDSVKKLIKGLSSPGSNGRTRKKRASRAVRGARE